MGDSCCNPITMGYFIDTIKSETDAYVLSLQIGDNAIDDTLNGFFLDTNAQIEMVCKQIAEDPELQNGYNAIGLSQGGQFLRAVAQRCPNPPMKNSDYWISTSRRFWTTRVSWRKFLFVQHFPGIAAYW